MKILIKISITICLGTVSLFAQESENYLNQLSDSSYRFQGIVPPVEFQYDMTEFYDASLDNQIPDEILFEDNSSTAWLRTELLISNRNLLTENGEVNTHFTSSLYKQHIKDSEFDMVSYVLGIAQTSAVAYMAYRHIKKYGFWK